MRRPAWIFIALIFVLLAFFFTVFYLEFKSPIIGQDEEQEVEDEIIHRDTVKKAAIVQDVENTKPAKEIPPTRQESHPPAPQQSKKKTCYACVIDAGSSGSRIFIYKWNCRTHQKQLPKVIVDEDFPSLEISPGISSFNTPEKLAELPGYLEQLFEFARKEIPQDRWKSTPIFLRATAGMRLLPQEQQDDIFNVIRNTLLTQQTFFFTNEHKWARIISGEEEGVFGWLAVNQLTGKITQEIDPLQTLGAIDLGGASNQITFVFDETTSNSKETPTYKLHLESVDEDNKPVLNHTYNIYSYSHLGYGNDQARRSVQQIVLNTFEKQHPELLQTQTELKVPFPCYYPGYTEMTKHFTNESITVVFEGTGNGDECAKITKEIFNKNKCKITEECSLNGVYQPRISSATKFVGFSAIAYAANFMDIQDSVSPNALKERAVEVCSTPYQTLKEKHAKNKYFWKYCFAALYATELVTYGYGLAEAEPISVTNKINGKISVSWTLGSILHDANEIPLSLEK